MNVQELTESMHATSVPTPLDLDRVTRDGRRIRARRRAALAGGLAAALAAVAVPVGTWTHATDETGYAAPTGRHDRTDRARTQERSFRARAPLGRPLAGVLTPGAPYAPKLSLSTTPGGTSMGALSVWAERDGVVFGARDVDRDGALRRAGTLDLADLPRRDATLTRVPFQNRTEPTFVGLVQVPRDTRPLDVHVSADGRDSHLVTGVRLDVVPGRALVWVTASDGRRPGIDLTGFTVRDRHDRVLATGGFEPWRAGAWEPRG